MDREILTRVLSKAHYTAAMNNDNVSSAMVKQVAMAGKSLPEAIAAGLMTLGGLHAPVTQARYAIFRAKEEELIELVKTGQKIAGFGNSFFPNRIDPAWNQMDLIVRQKKEVADKLDNIATIICANTKLEEIYPNAAAYTAIAAEWLEMPWSTEQMLVVLGRVPAWTAQFVEAQQ